MNILFTTAAAPKEGYFCTGEKLFPVGIGYLAAVLRKAGHTIFFKDPYYDPTETVTVDWLEKNNIDAVGIYCNTICMKDVIKQVNYLSRNEWRGRVIMGGPHWSYCHNKNKLGFPGIYDVIMVGEAENYILEIIEHYRSRIPLNCKPNLDLDSLPFPAYDLRGDRKYAGFNMNTSRGCPYNCKFCSSGVVEGKKHRALSADRLYEDVVRVNMDFGVNEIYFRENNFCFDQKRVKKFCELLLVNGKRIRWKCEASVKDLPKDVLILMRRAGCVGLYIGFETGSPRLLPILKPGFKIEDSIRCAKDCIDLGFKLQPSFVVGTPDETEEDVQETFEFVDKYLGGQACYNVFVGLPGSKYYDQLLESGDYQYMDDLGLIFLHGHNERVKRFYKVHEGHHFYLKEE